jgi:SAM-dependent methyltransferase
MSRPPDARFPSILEKVARYYDERLVTFGDTPQGVDWNSADSQSMRFGRLLGLIENGGEASINDFGCGYGALVDYLGDTSLRLTYCGFDISLPMIAAARARHDGRSWCRFTADPAQLLPADYTVASGIFNVKLDHANDLWQEYLWQTVATLDRLSTKGFAFNALSTYSDPEKRRTDLFYADPLEVFDVCKRRFSPKVSLLHDYPLYEFTILVRK